MGLRGHRESRKRWPPSHRCPSTLESSPAREKPRLELAPRACATIGRYEDPHTRCSSTFTPIHWDTLIAERSRAKPRQLIFSNVIHLGSPDSQLAVREMGGRQA